MIPFFVISLSRSKDRRASVAQQMDHLGIEFEFIDAIDGKTLKKDVLDGIDFELAKKTCGHDISLSELGCAMSHIKVYEKIISENIDKCIIMEDDMYLHMHVRDIIDALLKKDRPFDIVFLRHGKVKSWPIKANLFKGYRLARYISPSKSSKRFIVCAGGYILTRQGAEKLLQKAYPIRMPADYLTGYIQWSGLRAYGVEPCCMDTGMFDTTIDDRHYGEHLLHDGTEGNPSMDTKMVPMA